MKVVVCPGCTDARFIRQVRNKMLTDAIIYLKMFSQLNISALGFTPIRNTPLKLHDHDEFIFADGYLDGINIYKRILLKIGNV